MTLSQELQVSVNEPTKVVERLIDAFNRSDWGDLRSIVAEDIVYQETGTGRRIQGVCCTRCGS